MNDFWNAIPTVDHLRGEGNVEHRLILPLLHALGYEDYEIEFEVSGGLSRRASRT